MSVICLLIVLFSFLPPSIALRLCRVRVFAAAPLIVYTPLVRSICATMADLDDFFAKKDRKKSKSSTKKFPTTTEELVKKIEDTSARTAKSTEVRPPQSGPAAADGNDQSADTVEQVGGLRCILLLIWRAVVWKWYNLSDNYHHLGVVPK